MGHWNKLRRSIYGRTLKANLGSEVNTSAKLIQNFTMKKTSSSANHPPPKTKHSYLLLFLHHTTGLGNILLSSSAEKIQNFLSCFAYTEWHCKTDITTTIWESLQKPPLSVTSMTSIIPIQHFMGTQLNYRLNHHPPRLKSSILFFKQLCFPSSRALQPTYYITSQICF